MRTGRQRRGKVNAHDEKFIVESKNNDVVFSQACFYIMGFPATRGRQKTAK